MHSGWHFILSTTNQHGHGLRVTFDQSDSWLTSCHFLPESKYSFIFNHNFNFIIATKVKSRTMQNNESANLPEIKYTTLYVTWVLPQSWPQEHTAKKLEDLKGNMRRATDQDGHCHWIGWGIQHGGEVWLDRMNSSTLVMTMQINTTWSAACNHPYSYAKWTANVMQGLTSVMRCDLLTTGVPQVFVFLPSQPYQLTDDKIEVALGEDAVIQMRSQNVLALLNNL
jgi:hypothetical protein